MDPVYVGEGVMVVTARMLQHLPVVYRSLREAPPTALLEGRRRTVFRCNDKEVLALGSADGAMGLALAFAGVDAARPEMAAWWCVTLDPLDQRSTPYVGRLFPPDRESRLPGAYVREVVREVWDAGERCWIEIPGAPRLLQRDELH